MSPAISTAIVSCGSSVSCSPLWTFCFFFFVLSVAAISRRHVKLPINPVHSRLLWLWSSTWTQVLEAEHEHLNLLGPRVGGLYGKRRSW
ncbi:uncharacterized protein B0T23DRAFT_387887 [Neurospora hispaniola]|uniref:Uncharacterized protein n=1 Tax=Neurospora hispaniola TaxID=588809 RepID=A0AAJ0I0E0_9PEZI|nr:hypothetical protein B0T23DRAFT_387887 [Neurospora hispaniola]